MAIPAGIAISIKSKGKEMKYRGYDFQNTSRGFGNALDVTHPDKNQSQWCTEEAGDYQASVKSPMPYASEIDPNGSANGCEMAGIADAIITRIEAGNVQIDNRNEIFRRLNSV